MFLKCSERKTKGKTYKYYNVVEAVRVDGKVKHNILVPLGNITDEKAAMIREVLKIGAPSAKPGFPLYRLNDIVITKSTDFLNIYVLHKLWCEWGLDALFLGYPHIEKLVINRCINPMSKYRAAQWEDGELIDMLNFRQPPNPFGAYGELDRIAQSEEAIQKHLCNEFRERDMLASSAIIYDITSTYFEQTKCTLAFKGYSRDHRPDKLQIIIAMAITTEGYPFYWKVYEGNTPDVTTVEGFADNISKLFGVTDFVFVFDRGMVSRDNIDYIEEKGYRFISAIDRNEIRTSTPVDVEQFRGADSNTALQDLAHFAKYDDSLWYREYETAKYRYVIGFSAQKLMDERALRQRRLAKFDAAVAAVNDGLSKAKRSRKRGPVERTVEALLKKTKLKQAVAISISEVAVKNGKKAVNSYIVSYAVDQAVINDIELTDGLTCFHTNTSKDDFSATGIIRQYREKNAVEEGFREIKGVLELRPVYLSLEDRVKAHVTVCILAYLLWNTLEKRVSKSIGMSASDILHELSKCKMHTITATTSHERIRTLTRFTNKQLEILMHLQYDHKPIERHFKKLVAADC